MIIKAIKIDPITPPSSDLKSIFDRYLPRMKNRSVLAITSKIVSICEGRTVKMGTVEKRDLILKEADYFIPPEGSKYGVTLTIKNNFLMPTAGIDESNGNGYYILLPKNPQASADKIRSYLKKRFSLELVGVIITDSVSTPLRWGTHGVAIAHSGFLALNDYIGKKDIFGREFKFSKANIADALAAAAVGVMGEGNEQTPMAIIEDIPFVTFQKRNPTRREREMLRIAIKDDLYFPLFKNAKWRRGRRSR